MPLCPYHMDRFVDLPSGDYLISATVRLTRFLSNGADAAAHPTHYSLARTGKQARGQSEQQVNNSPRP